MAISSALGIVAVLGIGFGATNKKVMNIAPAMFESIKQTTCWQKENLILICKGAPKEERRIIENLKGQEESFSKQEKALDPKRFQLKNIGAQNMGTLMLNPHPEKLKDRISNPVCSSFYTAKRTFFPAYTAENLDLLRPHEQINYKKISYVAKALNKNTCLISPDQIRLTSSNQKTKITFNNLAIFLKGNYTIQGWGYDSKAIFDNMIIEIGTDITDEESAEEILSYENISNAFYTEIAAYHQQNEKIIQEKRNRAQFLKEEAKKYAIASPEMKEYLMKTNCPTSRLGGKTASTDPLDFTQGNATTTRCGLYEKFNEIANAQKTNK